MTENAKKQIWSRPNSVDPVGKEILVICCSDGRFIECIQAFLYNQQVKNYDLIAVPGSVHFLVTKLFPKYSWVARRWVKFFFKHHNTKRVIVFSHQDCGWYKFLHSAEVFTKEIFETQQKDVQEVPAVLADIKEDNGIAFEHYFISFNSEVVSITSS